MEITGSIKGEVAAKQVTFCPSESTRIAIVTLKARFSPESARAALGKLGEKAMFSGWFTDEADGDSKALFKTLTPNVVFEEHVVELMDWKGNCTPKLGAVKPVKGESKVDVDIEIPLPVVEQMRAFYGTLCLSVGTTQTVKFKLAQPSLPATGPKVVPKPGPHGSSVATTVGGDAA